MFKKIIRMALPLAVALGLFAPFWNAGLADEQKGTDQKTKKKTDKSKRKGGGQRSKAEQPKAQ